MAKRKNERRIRLDFNKTNADDAAVLDRLANNGEESRMAHFRKLILADIQRMENGEKSVAEKFKKENGSQETAV